MQVTAGSVDPGSPDVDDTRVLAVPIRSGSRHIGTLGAVEATARDWQPEDRTMLAGFADCLAGHIELNDEVVRRRAVEDGAQAAAAGFLSVSENIPALVFERRKIDAGRSSYRFFGRGKSDLPAVRELTANGEASALNFIVRDDRAAVRAALLRSNLEETDLDLTFRVKDFGQRTRWVRSQSILRREDDGSAVWDGFCFDVSDLMTNRETAAERSHPLTPPVGEDLAEPLKAIIEICEFLKVETQPALVGAHARTIQSTSEALLALLAARVDAPEKAGPIAKEDRQIDRDAAAPSHMAGSGARILIADDLDLNRKLISDMLSLEGHSVDAVADGAAAVEAVKTAAYDIVLMDMVMPGMDGLAATQAIRALPGATGTLPIIGLTAHSELEELERCIGAGMDAVLTKPMSMDALSAVVLQWTRGRKAA